MQPGAVLAFRDKRNIVLALVRKEEGKKLRVVNEKGKEFPFPRDRVALELSLRKDPGLGREEVREELAGLHEGAAALQGEVDLELLWESVREDRPDGGDLQQLGRLYFGEEASDLQMLALLQRLEADSAYFKRKGEVLVPKDEEAVRETLRQIEEAERRERERREALEWILARLEGRGTPGEEPPAGYGAVVELLKAAAIFGDQADDWTRSQEALKALGAEPGKEGAFELLVDLGVFSPDENLALHEHEVALEFPADVLEEAARLAETDWRQEERRDLTGLETLSIDDHETTEVDDALSLEPLEGGGARVWIHIADAATFVPKGSLVDREAMRRATTVYMPDLTVPMLPEVLSMNVCSLQEGEERPALSLAAELSAEGELLGHSFHASRIRVDRALTYEEAETAVEEPGLAKDLYELSTKLRKAREDAGAQSYERQELRVKVSEDGEITLKKVIGDTRGQVLVSEMMVLANRVAGQGLAEAGVPALYKRQSKPEGTGGYIPKSTLGLEPGEHYGLAVPYYCQMTSPIRRYGDLAVHRQIGTFLGRPLEGHSARELETVLGCCQARDEASFKVQRTGKRYWLLKYLEDLPQREHAASVGSLRRGALMQVKLEDFLLPVMMPIPKEVALKEGERILVRFTDVDARRNRVRIRFLERLPTDVDKVLEDDRAARAREREAG